MQNSSTSKKTEENIPGYPRIEKLIDTEEFDPLNKDFAAAYDELEKIARQKAGLTKSKQAKKVMKSLELVMTLLKDLLKLKYQMVEASKK